MLKKIGSNINRQSIFFMLYGVFILLLSTFLFLYEKKEGHIILNQTWTPFQDTFFTYVTLIGDGVTAVIVVLFLAMYSFRKAFIALAAFVATALTTQFLKLVIFSDVLRPNIEMWEYFHQLDGHVVIPMRNGYSFPSGHTTSAFSIFCLLALFSNKKWVGIPMFLIAALAGYSRVYLSQHFVEDIFVGSMIGTFGSLVIYSSLQNAKLSKISNQSILGYFKA